MASLEILVWTPPPPPHRVAIGPHGSNCFRGKFERPSVKYMYKLMTKINNKNKRCQDPPPPTEFSGSAHETQ